MTAFGPLLDYGRVEDAIRDDILAWIDTYLLLLEDDLDLTPRSIMRPKTWRVVDDVSSLPEDQLPVLTVVSGGEADEPDADGEGQIDGLLEIGVRAVGRAGNRDETRLWARRYGAVIAAIVEHKGGDFGGLATLASRPRQLFGEGLSSDQQHLGAAYVVFNVWVEGIRDRSTTGPAEPAPAPPGDAPTYPDPPTAETVVIHVDQLEE